MIMNFDDWRSRLPDNKVLCWEFFSFFPDKIWQNLWWEILFQTMRNFFNIFILDLFEIPKSWFQSSFSMFCFQHSHPNQCKWLSGKVEQIGCPIFSPNIFHPIFFSLFYQPHTCHQLYLFQNILNIIFYQLPPAATSYPEQLQHLLKMFLSKFSKFSRSHNQQYQKYFSAIPF